jgi:site-specific recombinase XerD
MTGLREILRRRSQKAGIPEPQIHDFRRAFAIESLRNNGDLARLSYFLGHSDIKTTQRYLHITDEDLAEFHDLTSPVQNLP